jgi:hypothetical protein
MNQHRKRTERPLHARLGNAAACEWQKWKLKITQYCLQSQTAADMKADAQPGSGEISAALGHLGDATKSTCGHANMCKGRGRSPARVTAAREVKARAEAKVKQLARKTK